MDKPEQKQPIKATAIEKMKEINIQDYSYEPSLRPSIASSKRAFSEKRDDVREFGIFSSLSNTQFFTQTPEHKKNKTEKTKGKKTLLKRNSSVKNSNKKYISLGLKVFGAPNRHANTSTFISSKRYYKRKNLGYGSSLLKSSDLGFNRKYQRSSKKKKLIGNFFGEKKNEFENFKGYLECLPAEYQPDPGMIFKLESWISDLVKEKDKNETSRKSKNSKHETQIKTIMRQAERNATEYRRSLKKISDLERDLASLAKKVSYLEREVKEKIKKLEYAFKKRKYFVKNRQKSIQIINQRPKNFRIILPEPLFPILNKF